MIKALLYNLWLKTCFDFYADMERYRRWMFLDKYEEVVPVNQVLNSHTEQQVCPASQKTDHGVSQVGFELEGPSEIQSWREIYLDKFYEYVSETIPEIKREHISIIKMDEEEVGFKIKGVSLTYWVQRTELKTW